MEEKDFDKESRKQQQERDVVAIIGDYRNHFENYVQEWQDQAELVWRMIHGDVDWSHKSPHHAKIHLNKLGLAQDRFKASVKSGLMNFDKWLQVKYEGLGVPDLLSEFNVKRMVEVLTRDINLKAIISDNLGVAYVENLAVVKVLTEVKEITGPGKHKLKSPRTKLIPLDIFTYGADPDEPDADGCPLYEFQVAEIPKYRLLKMSSDKPTKAKPYIREKVKLCQGSEMLDKDIYSQVKGQEISGGALSRRKNVVVTEFYGDILDDDGNPYVWIKEDGEEMELENVCITIAENTYIIREPQPLSELFIDGDSPFVRTKLLRSHKHLYGKSLAHPGYEMNRVLDEMTSAITDSGMKAANNLIAFKADDVENPEVLSGGIQYDQPIAIASGANPRDVIHSIQLGQLPPTFFTIYGEIQRALAENIGKTEIGLSGNLPDKQVRATELVQSQQISQGLDESIHSDIEDIYLEKLISKIFRQGLMLANKFNDFDLEFIFEDDFRKIEKFKELAKSKKDLFDKYAYSFKFKGKGLRGIMNSARLGQMSQNLLNMGAANPIIMDVLERDGYNLSKLFSKAVQSMGFDPEELKDPITRELAIMRQNARAMGEGMAQAQGQGQGGPQANNQPNPRQDAAIEPGNNYQGGF